MYQLKKFQLFWRSKYGVAFKPKVQDYNNDNNRMALK